MAASTDTNVLANNARCYEQCIAPGMQLSVQTYLLAVLAGAGATNPRVLANAARCFFSCIPNGNQASIQNYLLAVLAGDDVSNPSALANQARCFEMCQAAGTQMSVQTYLFAVLAGLDGTDPKVLANQAVCFTECICDGEQMAVQNYLLAGLAFPNVDPGTIQNNARCFSMCVPPSGQRALRAFLLTQVSSCTAPQAPNKPSIVLVTDTSISISWNQPLTPGVTVTSSVVKWGTSSGVYTNMASVSGSTLGYSITGLTPGTTYFITVQAFSGACGSPNATEISTATEGSCDLTTNPKTTAWLARLSAPPSQATIDAVNCFANAVDTSLVVAWTDLIGLNFFPPESLTDVARYAYILGPASDPWNIGGSFVNADLNVNGLKGDGVAKAILTGINGSNFSSVNNAGVMIYQTEADTSTGILFGSLTAAGANTFLLANRSAGNASYDAFDQAASQLAVPTPGVGFLSGQRTAANAIALYFATANSPHAAIATGTNATTGTTATGVHSVFALDAGGVTLFSNARISIVAVTNGLTAAKSAAWFALFQRLRMMFGGGYI